jgi:hypothetical protein
LDQFNKIKKNIRELKNQAQVGKGKVCTIPISINNKEDFNFNNIILDISSSRTALGP